VKKEIVEIKNNALRSENKSRKYEKPLLEEHKELTFPLHILEKFNKGRFCVQCSSCHGCR